MELLDRMHRTQSIQSLSKRIRSLSNELVRSPTASFLIRGQRRFAGALLLLVSLCMGIWARDLAQAESLGKWLTGHPPSEQIWRYALQSRGYRSLSEERAFRRAARTLPSLADEASTVWVSADGTWIATYRRNADRLDTALYCLRCKDQPNGWLPVGRGWEAFDPVLARADAAIAALKPVAKPRLPLSDPMELRY
jgi:hypothetical protein